MTKPAHLTDDELDRVLADLRAHAEAKRQRRADRAAFWLLYGQWLANTRPFEGASGPTRSGAR